MKYLWRIHLWFMAGCKPPAFIYPSVSTSVCDHKMAVLSSPDLLDLISAVWCVGRLMSHHGNNILIDASCCIATRGWAPEKADCESWVGMWPRHNRVSGHNVWQSKVRTGIIYHCELFISIFHWNLCLVVQICIHQVRLWAGIVSGSWQSW